MDSGAVASGPACSAQSHDRMVIVQGTTFTITGLAPATTYSVHVHPAASPCGTCTSGYNLASQVGTVLATTLGP